MQHNLVKIILDNGHGANTPGKRSPIWLDGLQLFEWEFTRDVVKKISTGLLIHNIASTILVPEAIDVSLSVRCQRANKIYSEHPDSFLISIHGNAGQRPNEGTGWEAWTSPGQTESDDIASILYASAIINLQGWKIRTDMSDGDMDKESKFTILTDTKCPAVLTENLFYDNEKDCRFMMSEDGRNTIAKLHIEGILKYVKS